MPDSESQLHGKSVDRLRQFWLNWPSTTFMLIALAMSGLACGVVLSVIWASEGGISWSLVLVFAAIAIGGLRWTIADDKAKGPRMVPVTRDLILSFGIIAAGFVLTIGFAIVVFLNS